MIGIYFSGTGNSKYCVEKFIQECEPEAKAFSIEEEEAIHQICVQSELVIGYPVQYSNIPKFVRDFIEGSPGIWKGKRIFVIATMGLFSGDGAGILARLLQKYGATITGGLHLKMPDCISDVKALKRPLQVNRQLVADAEKKIKQAAENYQKGNPTQEGIGFLYHLAGLFGQRLYFFNKTGKYSEKLKINTDMCVGCGQCEQLCPMKNITMERTAADKKIATAGKQCTMCYRCISKCPNQAITLIGKRVIEQGNIQKYL